MDLAARFFSRFRPREGCATRIGLLIALDLGGAEALWSVPCRILVLGAGVKLLQGPVAAGNSSSSRWARAGRAASG